MLSEKIGKAAGPGHLGAMNAAEVSLLLPISLLVAGLVLIAAEFFLPTVFLGFVGAAVSFAGIYLSAAAGALTIAEVSNGAAKPSQKPMAAKASSPWSC